MGVNNFVMVAQFGGGTLSDVARLVSGNAVELNLFGVQYRTIGAGVSILLLKSWPKVKPYFETEVVMFDFRFRL